MFKKSEHFKKIKLVLRLFKYAHPFKNHFILIIILLTVATLLSLVPTYIMKPLTDKVLAPPKPIPVAQRMWMLNELVILLVIVYVLKTITDSFFQYRREWLSIKLGLNLRKILYTHLQKLSLRFYSLEKVGVLHSRVCSDTASIPYFLTYNLTRFLKSTIMFLAIGVVLFYLNWMLALLLLLPIPAIMYLSHTFGERLIACYRRLYQKSANKSSVVFNAIKGILVVKTSVTESREISRFEIVDSNVANERLNKSKLFFLFMPALGSLLFISAIMIRWYGGWQVISGSLSLGALMVFIGYMWQFYGPIESINDIYAEFQELIAAAERFFKIMDTEPEVYETHGTITLTQLKGNVRFENITFSYDGKTNVLSNVNLEVQPGSAIGIVGPSGAGKSSLSQLVCRLFKPSSGIIYFDGYDAQKLELQFLRRQIGIILQDTFLFSGTIAENIAYAKPEASKFEIISAAKAAGAHDFIMRFPDAYDTFLGEGGSGLSGGEKQRISIARVLLKDSRIVIFDEATSSVDLLTQDIIKDTIKNLKEEGRTVFVISHQLSMMEITDRLIFLDKGLLVEQGTYAGLSKSGGALATFLKQKELEHKKERSLDFYVL